MKKFWIFFREIKVRYITKYLVFDFYIEGNYKTLCVIIFKLDINIKKHLKSVYNYY